ncbi:MAG: tail fiber domain-containing protein, partial [archaeon]
YNTLLGYRSGYNLVTQSSGSVNNLNLINGGNGYDPLTTTVIIDPPVSGVQAQATAIISTGQNEIQRITPGKSSVPDDGTYTLTFNSETTTSLNYDADSTTIQSALEALPAIGIGNVYLTASSSLVNAIDIEFINALGNSPQVFVTVDSSGLRSNGDPLINKPNIEEVQAGAFNGVITGFTMNDGGSGYTGTPSVTITGGDGQALASASMAFIIANKGNTALGTESLFNNTNGNYNTAIGTNALYNNNFGNYNTALGYSANVLFSDLENATAIGYGAMVVNSNTVQLGNTSITNVNTSGTMTLNGIVYPNFDGTMDQVLATHGNGSLYWKDAGGSGSGWSLTGNSDVMDGMNFIGTTNNVPLTFKVNNTLSGKIDANSGNTLFGYQAGINLSLSSSYESVNNLDLISGGSGYDPMTTTVTIDPPAGSGIQATADAIISVGENEIQRISAGKYSTPDGGTYTITFDGQTTSSLIWNADASTIQSALEALLNIGSGNISVSGDWATYIDLEFTNVLGNAPQNLVTVDSSNLNSGGMSLINKPNIGRAQAGVASGVITGFTMNDHGSGYTSTPNVTITGGDGQASASASMMSNSSPGSSGNTAVGSYALYGNQTGNYNTALGYGANVNFTNLDNATAIGYDAVVLGSNTIQLGNTSVTNVNTSGTMTLNGIVYPNFDGNPGQFLTTNGMGTLSWATVAGQNGFTIDNISQNMSAGPGSGNAGARNIAIGFDALNNNAQNYNIAIGWNNLAANTSGSENTAIGGGDVLEFNTTGQGNSAIGNAALYKNIDGNFNNAFGHQALYYNTSGGYNSAIGYYAMHSNTTGNYNFGLGVQALIANEDGNNNIAIGYQALMSSTHDSNNIAIGTQALSTYNSGSNLTAIGYQADVGLGSLVNATAIGYKAIVAASNSMVLGGTGVNAVNVGIGLIAPSYRFSVADTTTLGAIASFTNLDGTCTLDPGSGLSCPSDITLKKDINPLVAGLAELNQLNPVTYHFKSEDESTPLSMGLIAQEVQTIFPELVTEQADGKLSLNYGGFTPVIIKSIQELDLKVESLADITTPLIDENSNETFVGKFFDRMIAWFADSANGINEFVGGILRAKDKLCIGEGADEVCVTKEELLQMKNNAEVNTNTNSGSSSDSIVEPVPTCSDGIQNQNETGVDTGGVCAPAIDPNQNPDPILPAGDTGTQNNNSETGGNLSGGLTEN